LIHSIDTPIIPYEDNTVITLHGENDKLAPMIEYLNSRCDLLRESLNVIQEVFLPESKEMWAKTIANRVLDLLAAIRKVPLSGYEEGAKEAFSKSIKLVLETISDEEFIIDRSFCYRAAEYSTMIGNVAFICELPDTQEYIDKVRCQENAIYKLLLFVSARNSIEEVEHLFSQHSIDVPLFNNWSSNLFQIASTGFLDKHIIEVLNYAETEILKHEFVWGISVGDLYNTVTYRQSPTEKQIKKHISTCFQNTFSNAKKSKNKKTKTIAIYSENWFPGHSTHRTVAKYINALKDKYEFILLYSERLKPIVESKDFDFSMFKEKHQVAIFGVFDPLELSIVGPHNIDFDMIIYPDAGYDTLSVIFANMRLAPIQISMTGFPSSVFGGKLDYFISGEDVDDPKLAKENYDERLVLLPGFGAIHTRQEENFDYVPPTAKDEILIGGCWVGPKTNYCFLEPINEILAKTDKKCTLRIFPGISWFHHNKSYAPYIEHLKVMFDDKVNIEVVDGAEQGLYMKLMSEVDLVIDSHPWGGSNVISDCVHLRKPVIVWEGSRWFNRIGPAMLRAVGLEELIATNQIEYKEKCRRLIEDDAWRIEIANRLDEINKPGGLADTKIYDSAKGINAFVKFIDDCMEDRIEPGQDPIRFK